jgi:ABC-type uncharacterized transport system substrate-binding protein
MRSLSGRFLAAVLLMAAPCGHAYENVAVLVSTPSPATREFVEAFRESLAGGHIKLSVLDAQTPPEKSRSDGDTLIVAVGTQALQHAISMKRAQPILGVLIPQPAYEKMRHSFDNSMVSAILLDQPFQRQLRLLQRLLPEARTVGILLGPTSRPWEATLRKASKESGLKAEIETVEDAGDLTAALQSLLERSDVLLAVPDPLVHSRDTAQTMLLTSYRYHKPVIGYSQAYVQAGAVAAPYSDPSHIARQAAEIAMHFPSGNTLLPLPQAPQLFSISINRPVARSLGIATPDEKSLTQDLTKEVP